MNSWDHDSNKSQRYSLVADRNSGDAVQLLPLALSHHNQGKIDNAENHYGAYKDHRSPKHATSSARTFINYFLASAYRLACFCVLFTRQALIAWGRRRKKQSLDPRRTPSHRISRLVIASAATILGILLLLGVIFPSYTRPPPHYAALKRRSLSSGEPGRANLLHEKIFIASILYDPAGDIAGGSWGVNVLKLIDLLGPENTFLSIYESDSGSKGAAALNEFEAKIPCDHSLFAEPTMPLDDIKVLLLPDGGLGVRRMDYLAAARNRALEPLKTSSGLKYDKILYLNDIIFDPVDAAQLLFSTNMQEDGKTDFHAACGMDFVTGVKYYDTFATRDAEGYSIGLPLYPWFSGAGNAQSRRDVWSGKDHVQVKSCWGGITALDARFFYQDHDRQSTPTEGIKFRSGADLNWEASECCLIHADILEANTNRDIVRDEHATGIYLNPYIRVAYSESTATFLGIGRRFERFFYPFQVFVNHIVGLPWFNAHRTLIPGEAVDQTVWMEGTWDTDGSKNLGSWIQQAVTAKPGGYCEHESIRRMVSIRRLKQIGDTGKNWESFDWQSLQPYTP